MKLEELLNKVKDAFKEKNNIIEQQKNQINDLEYSLKESKKNLAIAEGKYTELKRKFDKFTGILKEVDKNAIRS